MRFESWYFFLVLLLLPLLHRWWNDRNRPATLKFSVPVAKSVRRWNPVTALLVLRYLGLACLVAALARPQATLKESRRQVEGIDIVTVMDVSASMNIEDLDNRPRIDVAKGTIRDFVRGRQNDRIGFVIFSGEPLTLAPPTLDYGLVLESIGQAEAGILKDGTAIGDGLSLAISRLKASKAKSKVIILLTDGDNNVGQIPPDTAGDLAKGYGIRVYTIAIGKEGRARLPIITKTPFGQTRKTYQWYDNALNPKLLKQIAAQTDGKFYRVVDAKTLGRVFREIDSLEKTEIEANEKITYEERYHLPLLAGFLLLLLEQVLGWGWWRVLA